VLSRQSLPVFGGQSPYLQAGKWQLVTAYRGAVSDKHYQGTEPFPELDPGGPTNRQNQVNVDVWYAATPRLSLAASIPAHVNSFTVKRVPPGSPAGTPAVEGATHARGLGDITLRARYWAMPASRTRANVAVGLGLKLPTGRSNVRDTIYGREVPVDWSIQPGDGGWGVSTSLAGFATVRRTTLFASAGYLANPRNTTGTPSFFPSLSGARNAAPNSATDQFSIQLGAAVRTAPRWPVPSLGWRVEGVPVSDFFGPSDGSRRPGTIHFLEPGLTFARGRHLLTVNVPVRMRVNIKDSPASVRVEDATVPDYMFMVAHSVRF
jgi:hypothetical protein